MRALFGLLIFVLSTASFGTETVQEPGFTEDRFLIDSKWMIFHYHKESRLLVTPECFEKKKKCQALKKLDEAKLSLLSEEDRQGGKNPGAQICKKLGGKVFIARDPEGNQNSFCRFKDDSLIGNGSLLHRAYQAEAKDR